jgi:hypothetical protein
MNRLPSARYLASRPSCGDAEKIIAPVHRHGHHHDHGIGPQKNLPNTSKVLAFFSVNAFGPYPSSRFFASVSDNPDFASVQSCFTVWEIFKYLKSILPEDLFSIWS